MVPDLPNGIPWDSGQRPAFSYCPNTSSRHLPSHCSKAIPFETEAHPQPIHSSAACYYKPSAPEPSTTVLILRLGTFLFSVFLWIQTNATKRSVLSRMQACGRLTSPDIFWHKTHWKPHSFLKDTEIKQAQASEAGVLAWDMVSPIPDIGI